MRLLPVLLAVLALAAGCGGGEEHSTYAEGLVAALSGVAEPSSLDAESLSRLAAEYDAAADRLAELTPPKDVAAPHERLVRALDAFAADLERASRVTADPGGFANEMARAQSHAEVWTGAFEQIRSRGYATVAAP